MFQDWAFHDVTPVHLQLIDKLDCAAVSGELPPGQELPDCESLATLLHIKPEIVKEAYDQLAHNEAFLSVSGHLQVISDANRLQALRFDAANCKICQYLSGMRNLGFSIQEATKELLLYTGRMK